MKVKINLSGVDKSETIVEPVVQFDGKKIEVLNEEELYNYIGSDEDLKEVFMGVDWDSYTYVLPTENGDYYSFKKEWTE